MTVANRILGCLNGIAVGDAIGKQTETLSPADVARWYPDGVRGFEGPPGEIRQLTQLSDRGFLITSTSRLTGNTSCSTARDRTPMSS